MSFSRQALASIALTGVYAVLAMAITVVLVRMLGVAGYGLYASVVAHISLLAVLVAGGLPMLITREAVAADHAGDPGLLRGLNARARDWVLAVSGAIALMAWAVWAIGTPDPAWWRLFWPALAILAGLGLLEVQGAALRALGQPVTGQIPASLVRPGLHLALLLTLGAVAGGVAPGQAVMIFLVAVLLALAASTVMLVRTMALRPAAPPRRQDRLWLKALLSLMIAGGAVRANQHLGGVMLEHLSDRREVALFQPVVQMAVLTLLGRQAITAVLTPRLKRALLQEDPAGEAQRLMTRAGQGIMATALVAAGALLALGPSGMAAVFGTGFEGLYPVLAVMLGGQILAMTLGHPLVALNQAGQERAAARILAASFGLNLALGLALIPGHGAFGAAWAAALSQVAAHLALALACHTRLSLRSDILAGLGPRRMKGRDR
ncbi:MAG: oligosaccharide flippase family protein [Pseudomonadota bacterium]